MITDEQYAQAKTYLRQAPSRQSDEEAAALEKIREKVAEYEAANVSEGTTAWLPPAAITSLMSEGEATAHRSRKRVPSGGETIPSPPDMGGTPSSDPFDWQYGQMPQNIPLPPDAAPPPSFGFEGPQLMRPSVTPAPKERGKYGADPLSPKDFQDTNFDPDLPSSSQLTHLFAPPAYLSEGAEGFPTVVYEPPLDHVQKVFAESPALQRRYGIPASTTDPGYQEYADYHWKMKYLEFEAKKKPVVRYSQIEKLFPDNPWLGRMIKAGSWGLTAGASLVLGIERGLTGGVLQEGLGGAADAAGIGDGVVQANREMMQGPGQIPGMVGMAAGVMSPGSVASRAMGASRNPIVAGGASAAADAAVSGGAELGGDLLSGTEEDIFARLDQIADQTSESAAIAGVLSGALHVPGSLLNKWTQYRRSVKHPKGRELALAEQGGGRTNLLSGLRYSDDVNALANRADRMRTKPAMTTLAAREAGTTALRDASVKINKELQDISSAKSAYYKANPDQAVPIDDAANFVDRRLDELIPEGGELPMAQTQPFKQIYKRMHSSADVVPQTELSHATQRAGTGALVHDANVAIERGLISRADVEAAIQARKAQAKAAGLGSPAYSIDDMKVVVKRRALNAKELDDVLDLVDDAAGVASKEGAVTARSGFYRGLGAELRKARDQFKPVEDVAPAHLSRTINTADGQVEVTGWSALNETMRERFQKANATRKRLGIAGKGRIDPEDPEQWDRVVNKVRTYLDDSSEVDEELIHLANANPQLRKELRTLTGAKFGEMIRGRTGSSAHLNRPGAALTGDSPGLYSSTGAERIGLHLDPLRRTLGGHAGAATLKGRRNVTFRKLSEGLQGALTFVKAFKREPELTKAFLAKAMDDYASKRGFAGKSNEGWLMAKSMMKDAARGLHGPSTVGGAVESFFTYGLPLRGGAGGRIEVLRREFDEDRKLTDTDWKILNELRNYVEAVEDVVAE